MPMIIFLKLHRKYNFFDSTEVVVYFLLSWGPLPPPFHVGSKCYDDSYPRLKYFTFYPVTDEFAAIHLIDLFDPIVLLHYRLEYYTQIPTWDGSAFPTNNYKCIASSPCWTRVGHYTGGALLWNQTRNRLLLHSRNEKNAIKPDAMLRHWFQ